MVIERLAMLVHSNAGNDDPTNFTKKNDASHL